MSSNDVFFGRMNDPSSFPFLKGHCGAETARLAKGKSIVALLSISAGEIMENIHDLPVGHIHCSMLAVSAFYKAVADYLLKTETAAICR